LGLTVLITNLTMDWLSGTVVYTRDLALELQRQGHRPIVYTWLKGRASRELDAAGIQVFDSLWNIHVPPDVIHGHYRALVRGALLRFPDVPAVAFCHNSTAPWDAPAPSPGIRRYFGVSELCVKRMVSVGAPAAATEVRANFVDLRRFTPRPNLPAHPARALVFSNYATAQTHLPAIEQACREVGVRLDVIGQGAGRPSDHPEQHLADYDVVFAVGKAALEAMAVGAAVVLCDSPGLGPMVTTGDFDRLRALNFGKGALVDRWTPEGILSAMARYDPDEAVRVRNVVRELCGLERAVADLVIVYKEVIAEAAASHVHGSGTVSGRRPAGGRLSALRYRLSKAPMVVFYKVFGLGPSPRRVPAPIWPIYRLARSVMRRLLWVR
jgi:hypothetical protein